MSKKRRAKIPPFRVLNSENIFRKFVSKIMRSCDKNFAQLQERKGNIRYFSDNDLEALRIIECLKKSGLEIKDIKQFFIWVSEGSSSYEKRKELFETRKSAVETEIQELQKTLFLLKFKCWYYETAMKDGNEDAINAMLPDKLPKICRNYMIKGMTDFCFLHQT